MSRPAELLRFAPQGGMAERVASILAFGIPGGPLGENENFVVLPDGKAAVTSSINGRKQLMIAEAGKDLVPLINTTEETSTPATAAGPDRIAFMLGTGVSTTIAIADTSNGAIATRIPSNQGPINSLSASPDGKVMGLGMDLQSRMWKFTPEGH
jgi:hypothetical protein